MSKEHPQPPSGFAFTEHEKLFDRLGHKRLLAMLNDPSTTVHEVSLSGNSFGEFLFVTASHPKLAGRECLTFWGLGFHERRERYLTDEWCWYESNFAAERMARHIDKQEALLQIQARRDEILPDAAQAQQSRRGQLFEMLADLTDEDGAAAEMDDLGDDFDEF